MTCRVRYVFADRTELVRETNGCPAALSDAGYALGALSVTVMVLQ